MIRIHKWNETFESAASRKIKNRLNWFQTPADHNSRGYRKLTRLGARGAMALGVFQSLCGVVCTLPLPLRASGETRHSNGEPMTAEDLEDLIRFQAEVIAESVEILTSIGWIVLLGDNSTTPAPPHGQRVPTAYPSEPQHGPAACPVPTKREEKTNQPSPHSPPEGGADEFPPEFWETYPSRGQDSSAIERCRRAWRRIPPAERPTRETLLEAIAGWKRSDHWQEGYIKPAHTFLRERLWESVPRRKTTVGIGFSPGRPKPPEEPSGPSVGSDESAAILAEFIKPARTA